MFLLNILKYLLNLFYKGKCETKLELFSLWPFSGYSIIYANVGGIKHPLKHDLALEFCRNQNQNISILTESHISYGQILDIKNIWLGPIFSLLESRTERLLVLLYPGLEGVTEVDTDLKGRFVSFKVTLSNDRVLCAYALSGHNTTKQLVRCRFLEGLKNYMENKNNWDEKKIIIGDFNCTMVKWTRMMEIKHKEFIDVVPIMLYQNWLWIMGLRIYGEGGTQIPLSSPATIDPLVQDSG